MTTRSGKKMFFEVIFLFQYFIFFRKESSAEERKNCERCKKNRIVFEGANCRNDFGDWLFSRENEDCIALAHNARGYDSQFLLR